MRKAHASQLRLDASPVLEVQLNLNCRDEVIPVLRALQHVYGQPQIRDEILRLINQDVNGKSSRRFGREGMNYWEILVLAAVRLGCNYDYDKLQDLAENHRALRQIMGLGDWDGEEFDARRIQDNITKLRPETIQKINHLIVAAGGKLAPEASETVRADSFVVETNIHYPTESTLIRDGLRKVVKLCALMAGLLNVSGWRQHRHLHRKAKKLSRKIERIAARKGNNYKKRLQAAYGELLDLAGTITSRAHELRKTAQTLANIDGFEVSDLDRELERFLQRTEHVCGTARRRVLEGEDVPNSDKLFSIFETHTQLYKRGKAGEPIQFGRLVLVYEDGAGFITDYSVLPREAHDRDVVIEQTRTLQDRLEGRIHSASFDRGFHSPENQEALAEIVAQPCLAMPGSQQSRAQEEQGGVAFHKARQRHPGIESAIGALQCGNGLERCRDRTEKGFDRYVGVAVLGRNLHVLGKLLIAAEQPKCRAALSQRGQSAA